MFCSRSQLRWSFSNFYVCFITLTLSVVDLPVSGKIADSWCESMGTFCHQFISVFGQHICKFSLGGIAASKRCLSGWSCAYRVIVHPSSYIYNDIPLEFTEVSVNPFFPVVICLILYFQLELLILPCGCNTEACASLRNRRCFISASPVMLILFWSRRSSSMQRYIQIFILFRR